MFLVRDNRVFNGPLGRSLRSFARTAHSLRNALLRSACFTTLRLFRYTCFASFALLRSLRYACYATLTSLVLLRSFCFALLALLRLLCSACFTMLAALCLLCYAGYSLLPSLRLLRSACLLSSLCSACFAPLAFLTCSIRSLAPFAGSLTHFASSLVRQLKFMNICSR